MRSRILSLLLLLGCVTAALSAAEPAAPPEAAADVVVAQPLELDVHAGAAGVCLYRADYQPERGVLEIWWLPMPCAPVSAEALKTTLELPPGAAVSVMSDSTLPIPRVRRGGNRTHAPVGRSG